MTFEVFALILIAAFLSRSMSLLVAGVLFAFVQFTHQCYIGPYAEEHGGVYALTAMLSDAICIIVVLCCSSTFDRNWHLVPLSIMMMLSIANNLYGLMAWREYVPTAAASSNGDYIYMAVVILLVGSNFSGGVVRACRNFINSNSPLIRWLPRSAESDS